MFDKAEKVLAKTHKGVPGYDVKKELVGSGMNIRSGLYHIGYGDRGLDRILEVVKCLIGRRKRVPFINC